MSTRRKVSSGQKEVFCRSCLLLSSSPCAVQIFSCLCESDAQGLETHLERGIGP